MKHEDVEKLLGGYATNNLTEAERKALFEAALDDQDLFNALQDEENLKDLLSDEDSRRELERALGPKPEPDRGWFKFGRPWVWAFAGSLATACLLLAVFVRWNPAHEQRTEVAVLRPELRPAPELRSVPSVAETKGQPTLPKPSRTTRKSMVPGGVIGGLVAPPEPAVTVPSTENQATPPASPVQAETSMGGPRQAVQLSQSPIMTYQASRARDTRQAFKEKIDEPSVRIVRGASVIRADESINRGDSIQFSIRAPAAGVLVLYKVGDSNPLTKELIVGANQTYTVPDRPLSVSTEQTYRLILSAAGSVIRSWDITLSPGNPVRLP